MQALRGTKMILAAGFVIRISLSYDFQAFAVKEAFSDRLARSFKAYFTILQMIKAVNKKRMA